MVAGAAAFICARLRGDRRYRPRFGEQYLLPFDYEPEKDDGKGM
jgi:hypothetical protein